VRGRGGGLAGAVALVAVLAGCAGTPGRPAGPEEGPVGAEPRLVHVHDFPGLGHRLAPPTGRPVLTRQEAEGTEAVRGFFRSGRPPEVRLADYTSTSHDPVRLALVWVAVDPDHPVVESGPDFRPAATGDPRRCPLYVVVDATSGRGYGAWQSCNPPYRG
jgi:hypothetical protein